MKKEGGIDFSLDYGCTQNVTINLEIFITVMSIEPISVQVVDKNVVEAINQGTCAVDPSIYKNWSIAVTRLKISEVFTYWMTVCV